jgi:uncharacterized membrane protein YhaH (DUF805 family)
MSSHEGSGKRILIAIVVALAAWGVLLAVGAYLGMWHQGGGREGLRDPRRFWIVLGIVAAFLAFWGVALAVRARRLRSRDQSGGRPKP